MSMSTEIYENPLNSHPRMAYEAKLQRVCRVGGSIAHRYQTIKGLVERMKERKKRKMQVVSHMSIFSNIINKEKKKKKMDSDPASSSTWASLRTWSKWTTILILLVGILIIFELMRLRHRTNALSSSLAWDAMDHMICELPQTIDDAVERALDRKCQMKRDNLEDMGENAQDTNHPPRQCEDVQNSPPLKSPESPQLPPQSPPAPKSSSPPSHVTDEDDTIEEFSTPGVLKRRARTQLHIVEVSSSGSGRKKSDII